LRHPELTVSAQLRLVLADPRARGGFVILDRDDLDVLACPRRFPLRGRRYAGDAAREGAA
jgi:hypothetical protein